MSRSALIMGIVGVLWGWYSESTAKAGDGGSDITEAEAVGLLDKISDYLRANVVRPE